MYKCIFLHIFDITQKVLKIHAHYELMAYVYVYMRTGKNYGELNELIEVLSSLNLIQNYRCIHHNFSV